MGVVASGFLLRSTQVGGMNRGCRQWPTDLPVSLVDLGVMETAEQAPVLVAADPAVEPVSGRVGVCPARWPVTAGEAASLVPLGDCLADRRGEQPLRPSDVEDLGLGTHAPWG